MPIALDGIRTCVSGIRAHSASNYTTTTDTPPVSRNKHFRHSPRARRQLDRETIMHETLQLRSYLRDRDAKHLQGPPLSRTRRVRERRKIAGECCGVGFAVRRKRSWKNMKRTPLLCEYAVVITLETQKCRKQAPLLVSVEWGLCALRHGIQFSMEAIFACHQARSTE